jgi:pSer/pThr/pTyr-binding forkhead associated (FHA) protein
MGVILEIKSGPLAGRSVGVLTGHTLLVGRAAGRAEFAVPDDKQMSGVHFVVECGASGCRVVDKGSTNGTFLNGARIREEMLLANCDEIKSGQTIFVVRIIPDNPLPALHPGAPAIAQSTSAVPRKLPSASTPLIPSSVAPIPNPALQDKPSKLPPAPSVRQPASATASPPRPSQPPALTIGGWAFHKIPDGWKIQEGIGIQQAVKDAFPASIGAIEEPLGPGLTLQHYVDAHTKMFREYLPDPKINIAAPPVIRGSVETVALEIQYSPKEGPSIFFRRDYARCSSILGVLTLTTLEKDLPSIRPVYDSVLSAISFSHKQQA